MHKGISELSRDKMERLKLESEERCTNQSNDIDGGLRSSEQGGTSRREGIDQKGRETAKFIETLL